MVEDVDGASWVREPVTVSVPATSANLGPGFDALGIALDHRDVVRVEVADRLEIQVEGDGADDVPRDGSHLVYRTIVRTLQALGREAPPLRLSCTNAIPHGRGLGSSSAAIVAGAVAARALVPGGSLVMDDAALLDLAGQIEGHADNVAPALLGGFTIAFRVDGRYAAVPLAVDPRIRVVVLVPAHAVKTTEARALLPGSVPHEAAAANAARSALLVAALTGRPELLLAATEDRLHQEYRRAVMPETLALVDVLRADGIPAVVSGAGPSVLAFATQHDVATVVGRAPRDWRPYAVPIDPLGARLL